MRCCAGSVCSTHPTQERRSTVGHAGYTAPTRQHELDHTDHTDHTDQAHICPERSRSWPGIRSYRSSVGIAKKNVRVTRRTYIGYELVQAHRPQAFQKRNNGQAFPHGKMFFLHFVLERADCRYSNACSYNVSRNFSKIWRRRANIKSY